MKKRILRLRDRWRSDYQFKIFFTSTWSVLIGVCFALFNAVLGVVYKSVWNGSISVYYILLAIVRGIIVISQKNPETPNHSKNKAICIRTHIIMIVMGLCLIAPITYMVIGAKTYKYGLIPAITMAVYTFYRVTMGVAQYLSSRKYENPLVKELRVINLQDALVAVLSLQNALIIVSGSSAESMILLTGWTSATIWVMIIFFTVQSFASIQTKNG